MQALIWDNSPDRRYANTPWHGTLICVANTAIVTCVSIWGARLIPFMQNGLFAFHVILFACVIIPLWWLAPHASTGEVFATFYNGGGWSSTTLCVFVGQISSIWACIGSDAAAHMAEEVRDASFSVARAIFWSYIINTCMGVLLVITVCFAMPDLDKALNDSLKHPFLYTFRKGMSHPAPTVITSGILVLIFASNVSSLISTARETFAFARDNGLPLSGWLGVVDKRLGIPRNALIFTGAVSASVSLIYIGSADVFKLIISLNTSSIMLAYACSIGSILWRRTKHEDTLPHARWSLGRLGVPTNIAALIYAAWAFFWSLWPRERHFRTTTFNWGIVLLVGVSIYSILDFIFRGREKYVGPATLIEKRRQSSVLSSSRNNSVTCEAQDL
jgi:choline transport protein